MEKFVSLVRKNTRTVIGMLSGTSVDAVDVVLVRIRGKGKLSKISVIDFDTYPVKSKIKEHILRFSSDRPVKTSDICRLNFITGNLFAEAVLKFLKKNHLTSDNVDLIGSHGQTIYHYPVNKKQFGYSAKSTLQTGEPAVIAVKTGIPVAADFRVADVASGGDGAPLVPYLDYMLFSDSKKSRSFINIGGISNATYLKKNCTQNEVIAFDTGPGNMMIDGIMKKLYGKKFDKDGIHASKGKLNKSLFAFMKRKDKYFGKNYPKSTGREYYGDDFQNAVIKYADYINRNDIIHTVTKFTAFTIYHNLKKLPADEIVISGGGASNKSLMKFLREYFKDTKISGFSHKGITADNKEAVLFAVLANELVNGNKTNMKSVSGSKENVFLGKICFA